MFESLDISAPPPVTGAAASSASARACILPMHGALSLISMSAVVRRSGQDEASILVEKPSRNKCLHLQLGIGQEPHLYLQQSTARIHQGEHSDEYAGCDSNGVVDDLGCRNMLSPASTVKLMQKDAWSRHEQA